LLESAQRVAKRKERSKICSYAGKTRKRKAVRGGRKISVRGGQEAFRGKKANIILEEVLKERGRARIPHIEEKDHPKAMQKLLKNNENVSLKRGGGGGLEFG